MCHTDILLHINTLHYFERNGVYKILWVKPMTLHQRTLLFHVVSSDYRLFDPSLTSREIAEGFKDFGS